MKKKSIIRKIAVLMLAIIFSESAAADTVINKIDFASENTEAITDSEHTEEAAEITTEGIYNDSVETPAAAEVNENTVEREDNGGKVEDRILSESALDFELDTNGIPSYALSAAESNSRYSEIDDTSKFYLNRYIGVRKDTMTECENNGLNISESIPMALLMQRLDIDYGKAFDMVREYASQSKSLETAMEYREKEFDIGFLSQEDIKPVLTEQLVKGYSTDEVINGFAAARCMGLDVKTVMTKEKSVITSNSDTFERVVEDEIKTPKLLSVNMFAEEESGENIDEGVLKIANKYNTDAEAMRDYMEANNITLEEMEIEIAAEKVELGIIDAEELKSMLGIQTLSEENGEVIKDVRNDLDYKEGPFNYKNSLTDSVDVGSGTLSFTDNVMSIPGINGLDLNISLNYSSKNNFASVADSRVNIGRNWQFSFPYLLTRNGENIVAKRENSDITYTDTPMYLVTASGAKYSIDYPEKKRRQVYSELSGR